MNIRSSAEQAQQGAAGLPPAMQNALGVAIRTAATLDGSPARCRLRACRKSGRCCSQSLGDDGTPCLGGFSQAAETSLHAIFLFLVHFVQGEPEKAPRQPRPQ